MSYSKKEKEVPECSALRRVKHWLLRSTMETLKKKTLDEAVGTEQKLSSILQMKVDGRIG